MNTLDTLVTAVSNSILCGIIKNH